MEERNVAHYKGKLPKPGLTDARNLTMEIPEGRQWPNHRLAQSTSLTYCPREQCKFGVNWKKRKEYAEARSCTEYLKEAQTVWSLSSNVTSCWNLCTMSTLSRIFSSCCLIEVWYPGNTRILLNRLHTSTDPLTRPHFVSYQRHFNLFL